MKKVISILMAVFMLTSMLSLFAIPTLADGEPVTICIAGTRGDDETADGTEAKPYKTFKAAQAAAAAMTTDVTVRFIENGNAARFAPSSTFTEAAHTNTITYTADAGVETELWYSLRLSGPTVFKNITFKDSSEAHIYSSGHKLVMGEGVVMKNAGKIGLNGSTGDKDDVATADMEVNSGSYGYIYTTGRYKANVTDSVKLVINNATVASLVVGGNYQGANFTKTITADHDITINSGANIGNVYVGANRSGAGNTVIFDADINIKINGGKYTGSFIGDHPSVGTGMTTTFNATAAVNMDFSNFVNGTVAGSTVNDWYRGLSLKDDHVAAYNITYPDNFAAVRGAQWNAENTAARFLFAADQNLIGQKVTVTVRAEYLDLPVKTFENVIVNEAYTTVLAKEDGVNTSVTADGIYADYIMALTLQNVPANTTIEYLYVTLEVNGVEVDTVRFSRP